MCWVGRAAEQCLDASSSVGGRVTVCVRRTLKSVRSKKYMEKVCNGFFKIRVVPGSKRSNASCAECRHPLTCGVLYLLQERIWIKTSPPPSDKKSHDLGIERTLMQQKFRVSDDFGLRNPVILGTFQRKHSTSKETSHGRGCIFGTITYYFQKSYIRYLVFVS